MKCHKRFAMPLVMGLAITLCGPVAGETIVGKWEVDFNKTAAEIQDPGDAKSFRAAGASGMKIEMEYRPDGTIVVTRSFGDDRQERTGKYKILAQQDDRLAIRVTSPREGILYADIFHAPGQYLNQKVLMKGTFREHYPESQSFGLGQGEDVVEVFYENLPKDQKDVVLKQKDGSNVPLAVAGVLQQSSVKDDVVFYIEAAGINLGGEVVGTDDLEVTFLDQEHCKMGTPGNKLLLIWRRVK